MKYGDDLWLYVLKTATICRLIVEEKLGYFWRHFQLFESTVLSFDGDDWSVYVLMSSEEKGSAVLRTVYSELLVSSTAENKSTSGYAQKWREKR